MLHETFKKGVVKSLVWQMMRLLFFLLPVCFILPILFLLIFNQGLSVLQQRFLAM